MKKMLTLVLIAAFLYGIVPLIAGAVGQDWQQKTYTLEQLKKFNGQNGQPAYAAVNGIIYDLSKIKPWKGGKHKNMHFAATDLTQEFRQAPMDIHQHVLEFLPKVGRLAASTPAVKAGDKAKSKKVKPDPGGEEEPAVTGNTAPTPAGNPGKAKKAKADQAKSSAKAKPAKSAKSAKPAEPQPAVTGEPSPAATATGAQGKASKASKAKAEQAKGAPQSYEVKEYKVQSSFYGKLAICPVTKQSFTITADTPAARYRGHHYYFCCPACKEKFQAAPEQYAKLEKAEGSPAAPQLKPSPSTSKSPAPVATPGSKSGSKAKNK